MLEFNTIEELKPNTELLELIKNFTYSINKGKIKRLLKTNLQFIEPTEYLITYPTTLTILEYKVNEISNKPFYIIEELQPIIKELYKYNRYCDGIEKRSIDIQNNIDNFDKDIGISNEKDNIRF